MTTETITIYSLDILTTLESLQKKIYGFLKGKEIVSIVTVQTKPNPEESAIYMTTITYYKEKIWK